MTTTNLENSRLIKEMEEKVRGLQNQYVELVEAFDNDGHRYQIPQSRIAEWFKFNEIPSDDERSWDVPDWAERIDGMPVTQKTYTHALSDVLNLIKSNEKDV